MSAPCIISVSNSRKALSLGNVLIAQAHFLIALFDYTHMTIVASPSKLAHQMALICFFRVFQHAFQCPVISYKMAFGLHLLIFLILSTNRAAEMVKVGGVATQSVEIRP